MLYNSLKILHVISAMILFGTSIGTALYMLLVNLQPDVKLIAKATKQVVFADWCFTGTSGLMQITTGLIMIYLKGYSFSEFWIIGSIIGYFVAISCWLPVIYLQMQCRNIAFAFASKGQPLPREYYYYFINWWALGIPAFVSLIVVFYLMANKPV